MASDKCHHYWLAKSRMFGKTITEGHGTVAEATVIRSLCRGVNELFRFPLVFFSANSESHESSNFVRYCVHTTDSQRCVLRDQSLSLVSYNNFIALLAHESVGDSENQRFWPKPRINSIQHETAHFFTLMLYLHRVS